MRHYYAVKIPTNFRTCLDAALKMEKKMHFQKGTIMHSSRRAHMVSMCMVYVFRGDVNAARAGT